VAAAHVSDPGTGTELCLHPVEGGQPAGDEVGDVSGAEEPLAAVEYLAVVLVPTDSAAGSERLGDPRLRA
jgi:hypothetical protein